MNESTSQTSGPEPAKPRRLIGLRWIVSATAALFTAVIVIAVGVTAQRSARATLTAELHTRLVLEARNLALTSAGALLSDFPELTLTPILAELREGRAELAFATVVSRDGLILGHPDARRIGERHELPPDLSPVPGVEGLADSESVFTNDALLLASTPVRRPGTGEEIGTVHVAINRAYLESALGKARRQQFVLTSILLALGLGAMLFLVSILLKPVGALRAGLERIGRGDLDTPVRLKDRTELGLLAETMNDMAARIQEAQSERGEKERLAHEVDLAREIQASLLPVEGLEVDGATVAGAHRAAAEVGGDFWDVSELPDGRVGIAVADVAGKGLAGCLVTSMVSALLGAFRKTETSPKALLVRLEDDLRGSLRPGTFITMFYGILDPRTGRLVFASAAHSPLLVHRTNGKTEWYRTKGIPIGAMGPGILERTLSDGVIALAPGDLALQYTDGINEAFGPDGEEQFGFGRLEKTVIAAVAGATAAGPTGAAGGPGRITESGGAAAFRRTDAVLTAIRHDVEPWVGGQPPLDDETLVVIARHGSSVDAPAAKPAAKPAANEESPQAILARARASGRHIRLSAHEQSLAGLLDRLPTCSSLSRLEAREIHVLEGALYEACANIAEHGLGHREGEIFDLWWLPESADNEDSESPAKSSRPRGTFVLLDHGVPFAPAEGQTVDFDDPKVRRRGRGLGLEIIRVAMHRARYHPGTPEGNVTILEFDAGRVRNAEEVLRA